MSLIRIQNLKKEFYFFNGYKDTFLYHFGLSKWIDLEKLDKHTALDGVSLEVKRGERVAILGKNGSGKSTLLKIIAGFITHTSGHVAVQGNTTALFSIDSGTNEYLTGRENIKKASLLYGVSQDQFEEYFQKVVDFSELNDVINMPVYSYSLGMKMRLQFAMATSIQSDILIIDEVLGAGDSYFMNKSRKRLEEILNRDCTLIMVSHSMKEVENLCTRAFVLDKGKIERDGEPREVISYYLAKTSSVQNLKSGPVIWQERPLSVRPKFLVDHVNEIESQLYKVCLSDLLFENRIIKYFVKGKARLSSFTCRFLGKAENLLYPGATLTCRFSLSDFESARKVRIKFYNQSCLCIGEFCLDFPEKDNLCGKKIDLTLSPLVFGSGDYQVSFAIFNKDDELVELYPCIYTFLIDYSNDSDPPMLHLPAQWDFGDGDLIESRISPYQ